MYIYVCVCVYSGVLLLRFVSLNKPYHLRVSTKKEAHSRQFRCVIYRRHLVCRMVCI